MPEGGRKWWHKPLRVIQFNIEDPYGFYAHLISADMLVAMAKKARANMLVVFARDAWGRVFYEGSRLYPRHPTSKLDVSELAEKARREGIHVAVMVAHTANRYLYRLHPDWAQRTRKGEVIVLEHYPRMEKVENPQWPLICPNSPALDLYFVPETEEAARITGADGILLDSFRYLPDPVRACYCSHCQLKFKREYGLDLPHVMSEDDVAFRYSWEWRYSVTIRALARMREAAKKVSPDVLFFYNSHPAGWAGRGNIVVIKGRRYLDAVFAEASETDVRGPGMLTIVTKLSKAALGEGDKPVFVSRNAFYDLRPVQSPPPETVRMGIWEIAASGGQPMVTIFSSQFFNDPRALEAVEEAYTRLEKVEEYMRDVQPLRYMGVIFDPDTHDKYYWRKPEYYIGEIEGFALAAMHSHIPWEFVASVDLNKRSVLKRYNVIVAAGMAVVDDEVEATLSSYVEEGGTLVATHEFGVMRPDYTYREALALQDAMGLKYEGLLWFGYSYLHLGRKGEEQYDELWKGLPEAVPFGDHSTVFVKDRTEPRLGEVPRVEVIGENAKVLAWARLGKSAYGYEYTLGRSTPAPDTVLSYVGLSHSRFGKGSILYYAHLIGAHYSRLGLPDYLELMLRPIREYAPPPSITTNAPETVQTEYYKQGDRLIVHLVNHTYNQRILSAPTGPSKQAPPAFEPGYRVHPIRRVIPIRGIEITADLSLIGQPSSVKAYEAFTRRPLKVEVKQGKARVELPELEEYSIVVIEPSS
ncbi:MAG: hypothetical protein F7C35_07275 [Desulfurococcales archaeon]|nr:hypothetical protein [Desulfurococcales archaeon]